MRQLEKEKQKKEHILVCLSSSPSNEKIIRTAAQMAQAFQAGFTALYVQTAEKTEKTPEDLARLQKHVRLAEQSGAEIVTTHSEDIALQIAEYARISEVTRIVIGKSMMDQGFFRKRRGWTERLTDLVPDLEIHIIPVILNINQLPDHIVPVLFHSRAERNNHLHVVLRASDSIDTRNTGNHNDIVPLTQCRSRGKPQLINLIVPRRVLRNIRIRRRHVSLRLVVVVVGDKVFDAVFREIFFEFSVKLRRQRLIVRNNQSRLVQLLDHIRHRKSLARARNP